MERLAWRAAPAGSAPGRAARPGALPGGRFPAGRTSPGRPGAQILLAILPFLVMAVVVVIDVVAGPGVGLLPLLSLGPALAAVSIRPGPTALIGGLALLVGAGLAFYDDLTVRRELIALAAIAGVTAAGVVASLARHRRERDLADMTAVAEAAQRVLLRPVPRHVGPLRVEARYISAAAAARIGGDLYGVIEAGGKVRLIIGDVQGKGLAAVQTAATVLGAFREAAHDAPDLPTLAARIELSLQRQAAEEGAEEEFVTAILAQVTGNRPDIEILNCGHPPPVLLHGPAARLLEPSGDGLPLGLAGFTTAARKADTVEFGPDEQILFYTDGISEARDKTGTFYQLSGCGALLAGPDPAAGLDRLHDDVIRHVGHELLDDAAMLLISRTHCDPQRAGKPASTRTGIGCQEPITRTVRGAPGLPKARVAGTGNRLSANSVSPARSRAPSGS